MLHVSPSRFLPVLFQTWCRCCPSRKIIIMTMNYFIVETSNSYTLTFKIFLSSLWVVFSSFPTKATLYHFSNSSISFSLLRIIYSSMYAISSLTDSYDWWAEWYFPFSYWINKETGYTVVVPVFTITKWITLDINYTNINQYSTLPNHTIHEHTTNGRQTNWHNSEL